MRSTTSVIALLAFTAATASAHPGHGSAHDGGFASGFLHPLVGWDHLLAMVAVGVLGARAAGHGVWATPLAFLMGMIAGGAIAWSGFAVPAVEVAIALSVLVLGALIALARPLPVWACCLVAGLFALAHGNVHVIERPAGDFAGYASGALIATAILHGVGLIAALGAIKATSEVRAAPGLRLSGAAVAAGGIVLLTQV